MHHLPYKKKSHYSLLHLSPERCPKNMQGEGGEGGRVLLKDVQVGGPGKDKKGNGEKVSSL